MIWIACFMIFESRWMKICKRVNCAFAENGDM